MQYDRLVSSLCRTVIIAAAVVDHINSMLSSITFTEIKVQWTNNYDVMYGVCVRTSW